MTAATAAGPLLRRLSWSPVALLALLAACSGAIWTEKDSWYAPAPADSGPWTEMSSASFERVDEGEVRRAVSMLEESPAVPIGASLASSLTGGRTQEDAWLVRGLCLACGIGEDNVTRDGTSIFVSHLALSRKPLPMRRWPLVIVGVEEILSVFVEVSAYQ